jgi:arylsulfatase A-like enzyme
MDWMPTLLAATGVCASTDFPPDGENILPVLTGDVPKYERTLYWRYKAHGQRAVRDGRWKYLRINDYEFLFDIEEDVRERANLKEKHPEIFARLLEQWLAWEEQMLPVTDDVYTIVTTPDVQAERYTPAHEKWDPFPRKRTNS